MTSFAHSGPAPSDAGWFARTEAWLDDKGKPAWIAAMVLGFIFVWPVGLALLFYMIWSKKMFCSNSTSQSRSCGWSSRSRSTSTTGNAAFDTYKSDTLRRLEEEQQNFEAFLKRLRDARDKAEFDDFMKERAEAANSPRSEPDPDRA